MHSEVLTLALRTARQRRIAAPTAGVGAAAEMQQCLCGLALTAHPGFFTFSGLWPKKGCNGQYRSSVLWL